MDIIKELNKPKNHQFNYQPMHNIKYFFDSEYEQREIQSKSLQARTFKGKNPIIGVAPVSMFTVQQYVDQQFKFRQLKQMTIKIQRYYILKKRLKALDILMDLVMQSRRATMQHMLWCWHNLYQSECFQKIMIQRVTIRNLHQEAQFRIMIKIYNKRADQHYIRRYFRLYYNETLRRITLNRRLNEYVRQRSTKKMANIYNLMKVKHEYSEKKHDIIKCIEQKDSQREQQKEKQHQMMLATVNNLGMDKIPDIKDDPFEQDIQPIVFKELFITRTRLLVSAQAFLKKQEHRYITFQKLRIKLDLVSLQGSALRIWQKIVRKLEKQRRINTIMFKVLGKNLFYKWAEAARGRHATLKYFLLKWIKATRVHRKEKRKELVADQHYKASVRKKIVQILKVYRTSMVCLRVFQQAVLKTPVSELICRSLLLIYVGRTQIVRRDPLILQHKYEPSEDADTLRAADVNSTTLTENVAFILQYKFILKLKTQRFRRIAFYRLVSYAYAFESMARMKACIRRWKQYREAIRNLDESEKERRIINNELNLDSIADKMNEELLDKNTIMEIKRYAQIGNSYSALVSCIESGTLFKQKMIYDVHGKSIKQLQSVIARAEQQKKGQLLNVYVLYILQMILLDQTRNQICIFENESESKQQIESEGSCENQPNKIQGSNVEEQKGQTEHGQIAGQNNELNQNQQNDANPEDSSAICFTKLTNDLEACGGRVDRVINVLRTVLDGLPLYDLVKLAGILDQNSGYGLSRRVQTIPGRPCTITFNTKQIAKDPKPPQLISNFLIPYAHFYIQNASIQHLNTRNGQQYIQQLLNQRLEAYFIDNNIKDRQNSAQNTQQKKAVQAVDMSPEVREVLATQIRRLDVAPTRAQLFKIETLVAQMVDSMDLQNYIPQKHHFDKKQAHGHQHQAKQAQKHEKSQPKHEMIELQEESVKSKVERQLKLVLNTFVRYSTWEECDIDVWARKSQVPQVPRPPIQQLFLSDLNQLFIGRNAFLALQDELRQERIKVKQKIKEDTSSANLLLNFKAEFNQQSRKLRAERKNHRQEREVDGPLSNLNEDSDPVDITETQKETETTIDVETVETTEKGKQIEENIMARRNSIELQNEQEKPSSISPSQSRSISASDTSVSELLVQKSRKKSASVSNQERLEVVNESEVDMDVEEKTGMANNISQHTEAKNISGAGMSEEMNNLVRRPTFRQRPPRVAMKTIAQDEIHQDDIQDLQKMIDERLAAQNEVKHISVVPAISRSGSVDSDVLSSFERHRVRNTAPNTPRQLSFTGSQGVFGVGGLSVKTYRNNSATAEEVSISHLDLNAVDRLEKHDELVEMHVMSDEDDVTEKMAASISSARLLGKSMGIKLPAQPKSTRGTKLRMAPGDDLNPKKLPKPSKSKKAPNTPKEPSQADQNGQMAKQHQEIRPKSKTSSLYIGGSKSNSSARQQSNIQPDSSVQNCQECNTQENVQTQKQDDKNQVFMTLQESNLCLSEELSQSRNTMSSVTSLNIDTENDENQTNNEELQHDNKPSLLQYLLTQTHPQVVKLITDAEQQIQKEDDGSRGYEKNSINICGLLNVLRMFFESPDSFYQYLLNKNTLVQASFQLLSASQLPRPQRLHFNQHFIKWFLKRQWDFEPLKVKEEVSKNDEKSKKNETEKKKVLIIKNEKKEYKPDQDFVDYAELLGEDLQNLLGLQNFAQETKKRFQIFIKVFPGLQAQNDGPFRLGHIGLSLGVDQEARKGMNQDEYNIDHMTNLKSSNQNSTTTGDRNADINAQRSNKANQQQNQNNESEQQVTIKVGNDKHDLQRFRASARRRVIVEKINRYELEREVQHDRRISIEAANNFRIGITSPIFRVESPEQFSGPRGAFGNRARSMQATAAKRAERLAGYEILKAQYRPGTQFSIQTSQSNIQEQSHGKFTRAHMVVYQPVYQVDEDNYIRVSPFESDEDMTISMLQVTKNTSKQKYLLTADNKSLRQAQKILIRSYVYEDDLNSHITNTQGYTRIIPVSPIRQFSVFNNVIIANRQLRKQHYPRIYAVVGTRQESRRGMGLPQILVKSYNRVGRK